MNEGNMDNGVRNTEGYQPKGPELSNPTPSGGSSIKQHRSPAATLAAAADLSLPSNDRETIERLGNEIGKAEIAAAQDLLTEAQNFLAETKARVEKHRADWTKEYHDLVERSRRLGSKLVDAHREYHGESRRP